MICVAFHRVGGVFVLMNNAFRPAGGAGGIHPERHVAPFCRMLLQNRPLAGPRPIRRVEHGDGAPIILMNESPGGDNGLRATVLQIEVDQVRRRQRVDQHRRQPRPHRAHDRRRIGRFVIHEKKDTVARFSKAAKRIADPRGLRRQFRVGKHATFMQDRRLVSPILQIVP